MIETQTQSIVQNHKDLLTETWHWTKISKQYCTFAPSPEMLHSEGLQKRIKCKLLDEPKGKHTVELRNIIFDSSYVQWKIEDYLNQRLGSKYPAELVRVLQEVLKKKLKGLPEEF